jgi:hypothetical protein
MNLDDWTEFWHLAFDLSGCVCVIRCGGHDLDSDNAVVRPPTTSRSLQGAMVLRMAGVICLKSMFKAECCAISASKPAGSCMKCSLHHFLFESATHSTSLATVTSVVTLTASLSSVVSVPLGARSGLVLDFREAP